MDLSVVIAVHNEADNLPLLAGELDSVLKGLALSCEVLVVDDGSTDETAARLRALLPEHPWLTGVFLESRAGLSAALEAGVRLARGGVIVTMDGDLQHDPRDIPVLLEALEGFDAVAGWRARRRDDFLRRASSLVANRARRLLTGDATHDAGCTFRAVRAEALDRLPRFDGMHRFFSTLCRMEGLRLAEAPINHRPRRYGRSKFNIRNRLFRVIPDALAVRWMQTRRLTYRVGAVEKGGQDPRRP